MIELTAEKENLIKKLASKYNLRLLLLFGSQVKGKLHKESDYDIAYLADKPFNLMEEARLAGDLGPIFKTPRIDAVNLKTAPPLLMKLIFDDSKILFYREKRDYFIYGIYALRKYREAKPLFDLRDLANLKYINRYGGR